MTDYIRFECPECGFDSVQRHDFKGSIECPLCAGDSGHSVAMTERPALPDDKPEGFDARTYPDDQWTKQVCKIGQRHDCCRYLTITSGGWSCEKHSKLKSLLDERVRTETITARGDNCPGKAARHG